MDYPNNPVAMRRMLTGDASYLPSERIAGSLVVMNRTLLNRVDELIAATVGLAVYAALRSADSLADRAEAIVEKFIGVDELITRDESYTFKVARAIATIRRINLATLASAYMEVAGNDRRAAIEMAAQHVIVTFVYELAQTVLTMMPKLDTASVGTYAGDAELLQSMESGFAKMLPNAVVDLSGARGLLTAAAAPAAAVPALPPPVP